VSAGEGGTVVSADAIVVAAGMSRRMGGRDKLGARIAGRRVLEWTIDALLRTPGLERVVVVTAPGRVAEPPGWASLPDAVMAVVPGGVRRQDSVAAGFAALEELAPAPDDRVLLVHDGARPLVSAALTARVALATARYGAAIPVVPIAETLKRVTGDLVETTVDRTSLAAAQTPQGVRRGILREAYRRFPPGGPDEWSDEASLLESCNIPGHAIPGESGNLKVTLAEDLLRVEAALLGRIRPFIGYGSDSHPFGPGEPLNLGGISIPGAPRLHGHSDGDVALHAIADALLGAVALGDLGRIHPAGPETPGGIASGELLRSVVGRLAEVGYRPASIDVTIVAARPRLGGFLDDMRAAIAGLVGLGAERVSVKASTGNLAGMEGAGRGVSAQAVALVEALP
jgi:2-C-methyl-D-erythritol 4-phosphate cytidylyltransferase/2-C-methyl-D-erythritol 2,4-cyclodiphosphate synthase